MTTSGSSRDWAPGDAAAAVSRTVFGAAAEAYDAGRPGYHPALVEQVLGYAGDSRTAVEIGAGTGKATVLFARAGVAVVREVRLRERTRYDTERYLRFLDSVSTYRLLPEDRRERVLEDTGDLLDRHGGGITMLHVTDLFLARRQDSQPGRISPASYA